MATADVMKLVQQFKDAVAGGNDKLKRFLNWHQGKETYTKVLSSICVPDLWTEADAVAATRALLRAGLDPNTLITPRRECISRTFGQLALLRPPLLKVLLDAGTLQVNLRQPPDNSTLLHRCVKIWHCAYLYTLNPGSRPNTFTPPPKVAVASCKLLLKAGADPELGDQINATALTYALKYAAELGDTALVEALQPRRSNAAAAAGVAQAACGTLSLAAAVRLSRAKLMQAILSICSRLPHGGDSGGGGGGAELAASAAAGASTPQEPGVEQRAGVNVSSGARPGPARRAKPRRPGPGPGDAAAADEASLHADLALLLRVAKEKLGTWEDAIDLLPVTAYPQQMLQVELLGQALALRGIETVGSMADGLGLGARVHHGAQDMPVQEAHLRRFLSHFRAHPTHLGLFGLLRWNTFLKRAVCSDPDLVALLPRGLEAFLEWAGAGAGAAAVQPSFRSLTEVEQEHLAYCCISSVSWVVQVHDLNDVACRPHLFEGPFVQRAVPYHLLLVQALEMGFSAVLPGLSALGHFPGVGAEALVEMARRPACFQHLARWVRRLAASVRARRPEGLNATEDKFIMMALLLLLGVVEKSLHQPISPADAARRVSLRAALDAMMRSELWPALDALATSDVDALLRKIQDMPLVRAMGVIYVQAVTFAAALRSALDVLTAPGVPPTTTQEHGASHQPAVSYSQAVSSAKAFLVTANTRIEQLQARRAAAAAREESSNGGDGGDGDGNGEDDVAAAMRVSQALTDSRRLSRGVQNCWQCSRTVAQAGLDRMLVCGRCHDARYCSKECQKQHWKLGHRSMCMERDARIDISLSNGPTGATFIVPGARPPPPPPPPPAAAPSSTGQLPPALPASM